MFTRVLRHLHAIKHGDFRQLPDTLPLGFATTQLYAALFEALSSGRSLVSARSSRIEIRKPGEAPIALAVPGILVTWRLLENAVTNDPLLRDFAIVERNADRVTWEWRGPTAPAYVIAKVYMRFRAELESMRSPEEIAPAELKMIEAIEAAEPA
ncbi:MAG: hypothetical protein Q8R35_04010 [bacterium]|nr:hypothetical protein [bacterium]